MTAAFRGFKEKNRPEDANPGTPCTIHSSPLTQQRLCTHVVLEHTPDLHLLIRRPPR